MVTDEDRKAAAAWARKQGRSLQAANMLPGSCDTAPLVQAFARHRIAAEQRGYQQGMEDAAKFADDVAFRLGVMSDPLSLGGSKVVETLATAIRAKAEEKKHGNR